MLLSEVEISFSGLTAKDSVESQGRLGNGELPKCFIRGEMMGDTKEIN